jgi:hypothetical protein
VHASREFSAIEERDDMMADYKDYLLSPHELWARAFSQYVAVRALSAKKRAELLDRLYPTQWRADSFAPIDEAIEHALAGAHAAWSEEVKRATQPR